MKMFSAGRLPALGNTFIHVSEARSDDEEPLAEPPIQKALSIPGFIPWEMRTRYWADSLDSEDDEDDLADEKGQPAEAASDTEARVGPSPWALSTGSTCAYESLASQKGFFRATTGTTTRSGSKEENDSVASSDNTSSAIRSSTPTTPLAMSPKGGAGAVTADRESVATLIIRNVPHRITQSDLLQELNQCGFKGCFDFLYLPSTFDSGHNKGYAFVNLVNKEEAQRLKAEWHDSRRFNMPQESPALFLSPASIQGREANLARWAVPKMSRIRNPNHRPYIALPDDLESAAAATSPRPQQLPQPPTQTQPRRTPPQSPPQQPLRPQQEVSVQDAATSLVGQWCTICNLLKNTEANGLPGMIMAWDHEQQRYIVRAVADAHTQRTFVARLRPENVRPWTPTIAGVASR